MNDKKQLPGYIPVEGKSYHKESIADLRGTDWLPCEFRFRGLQPEIQKLREYLTQNRMQITYDAAVSGEIWEIRVIAEKATVGLIERFPALKATGLMENWDRYRDHGIYAAYSESGFSVITELVYAGDFEGHHEDGDGRWEWEYDMMAPINVRFTRMQTGLEEEIRYEYPFRSQWERDRYVRESDGTIFVPAADEAFTIENGTLRRYSGTGGPVHIPDAVTAIDQESAPFRGDPLITAVHIPGTVSVVSEHAFEGCVGLTEVILEEGVTEIGDGAFENCTALTDLRLPDSLRRIGSGAFRGCGSLDVEKLFLPACDGSNVFNPFEGCKNVPELLCSSDKTTLFYSDLRIARAHIPEQVNRIYESAFAFRRELASVKLPPSLKEIGRSAFLGCCGLRELIIPDTAEMIGAWAFSGCSALKEIRIPGSVTVIPDAVLSGCTELETIILEEGIEEIRPLAFEKCKKLKHVYLPASIRKKIRIKLFEKNPALIIHGLPGSPAEVYAKEKGFRFEAVGDEAK